MGTFSEHHFSNFIGDRDKTSTNDIIDFDNGSMIIHKENLKKYLEMYRCNTETEFKDTMWLNYGIIVKTIY